MKPTVECDAWNGIPTIAERRKADRFALTSAIRVRRSESAARTWTEVRGLNLSENGVAFLSAEPFPAGALLQLDLPRSRSSAIGRVRNCQARAGLWRVGIELAAPFFSMS